MGEKGKGGQKSITSTYKINPRDKILSMVTLVNMLYCICVILYLFSWC